MKTRPFQKSYDFCYLMSLLVCACVSIASGQDGPERLPPPDVPMPRLVTPKSQTVPYTGPPPFIDGPQVVNDPNVVIAPGIGPEELAPFEDSPLGTILPDEEYELYYAETPRLKPYKDGFFQKASLSGAWIGTADDPDDLGVTEIETFVSVAVPFPIREWPLIITPGYDMILLDGPSVTDLPPRLHTAYLDLMWVPQIINRYKLVLAVAPSVYSDFQVNDADMFRVTGKGLVMYDWIPGRVQLRAGVLYLGRQDIQLLPVGGVIWDPADWFHVEAFFPKPLVAVRFNQGHGYEDWLFTTAEFGGDSWSIERTTGMRDQVTYLDYRVLLGVERKLNGGAGYRLEGGYVWDRSIEFESGIGDFEPQDTFILRGTIAY